QQTRSAIRSFQEKQQLVVDGIVGPSTENALKNAVGQRPFGYVVTPPKIDKTHPDSCLDHFDFDRAELKKDKRIDHYADASRIVDRIITSWRGGQPIVTVTLVGHTDIKGRERYNQGLGLRRALAVRTEIQKQFKKKQPDLYYKVFVRAQSKG